MIPRTIHHIWVGNPMPDHLAEYVATWQTVHPDWEHHLWGDNDLLWLANRDLFDQAPDIVGPAEVGQLRADIARVEILHRYGGVYVDCDMEALRHLDPLLDVGCFAGFEEPTGRWVNNAVMGAEPGHPFLAELLARLPDSIRTAEATGVRRPNVFSGPQFVTPIWERQFRASVVVHPSWFFYPYRWDQLDRDGEDFPDAYAVHHWQHRRSTRGNRR